MKRRRVSEAAKDGEAFLEIVGVKLCAPRGLLVRATPAVSLPFHVQVMSFPATRTRSRRFRFLSERPSSSSVMLRSKTRGRAIRNPFSRSRALRIAALSAAILTSISSGAFTRSG